MPEFEDRSDAYQAAREAALGWLTANWDPTARSVVIGAPVR
jgi:hypothetical protein